jgi:hypothetical protein
MDTGRAATVLKAHQFAMETELKAYIQLFRNGLIENTLFRPAASANGASTAAKVSPHANSSKTSAQ